MNRQNVIRTITAIAVFVVLGWSFFYFSDDTRGYKPVDTSVAMDQINSGNVKSAQIDDREQQLRLTLNKANNDTDGSDKVITKYPTGYAVEPEAHRRLEREERHGVGSEASCELQDAARGPGMAGHSSRFASESAWNG